MKKFTKLSLVAALALSTSAFGATVSGTVTAYSYDVENTNATADIALTVKATQNINDNLSANITVVAVPDLFNDADQIQDNGTLTTEANVVATYANTTVKAGRQYIQSPMLYSFDWLMKPVAYQATALINTDIANTTLVAVDVQKMAGNTDQNFTSLENTNRAYGAVYSIDGYSAQAWYYNIEDNAIVTDKYDQVYLDATKSFGDVEVSAQYIDTDYTDTTKKDSTAYGIKASTKVANFDITVAAADVNDAAGAYIGGDSMVTSSWNTFASAIKGSSSMVSASTEVAGVTLTTSYADYDADAKELDIIAEYSVNNKVSLTTVYTDTNYNDGKGTLHALEVMATYSF